LYDAADAGTVDARRTALGPTEERI
jgi:hypothetical protein